MAKRRKAKKTSYRRKRRMGAIGGSNLTSIAGIVAGAVAAKLVVKQLPDKIDDKLKNAGVLALGAFLMPKLLKGDLGKALGNGMIAVGGAGLLGQLIPAIGAVDTIDFPVMVGEVPDNLSVVAGDDVMAGDDVSVLAGMDDSDDDDYNM